MRAGTNDALPFQAQWIHVECAAQVLYKMDAQGNGKEFRKKNLAACTELK